MTTAAIAQAHDRDAGRVHGGRVLADRAQAQAEAGAEEHPPGQRHREKRDVDQDRCGPRSGRRRSARAPARSRSASAKRQVDRAGSAASAAELRRPAALPNQLWPTSDGQAGGQEVDRDARDQLVAPEGDRGEAVDQRQRQRGARCRREPEPGRAGDGGDARRRRRPRPASCPRARCRRCPPARRRARRGRRAAAASPSARGCESSELQERSSRSITPAVRRRDGARKSALDRHPHHVVERAGEQDDQGLDHHDHLAAGCSASRSASSAPPW